MNLATRLLTLYLPLIAWITLGWFWGRRLPPSVPAYLGKFLFWIGIPISIIGFLLDTDLSGPIWIAPIMAWGGILVGSSLVWGWMQWKLHRNPRPSSIESDAATAGSPSPLAHNPTQGSLLLASMVGNTGYLGYPIVLTLVGAPYFGWAVFYDTLGSMLGAYGLGVLLASRLGRGARTVRQMLAALVMNPTLWSFPTGLLLRQLALPNPLSLVLKGGAWTSLVLSLLLIGMRLGQLQRWKNVRLVSVSLGVKMLLMPLVFGGLLTLLGIQGPPRLVIVLQMAMPPAFATLVLAETFDLDRDVTVTAIAVGSTGLLVTLPLWVWLFSAG
ncbi:AEC family transporter [Vacuolonema iberomarrocanum]|uniref:AEC family transporter n=1 Tax=Vacuolonema iberomarrocanum TaxID=3454632 RepID=UPI0019F13EE8|nr:AEC family transporter [filamentous cyanobacterium LEGE 07170]